MPQFRDDPLQFLLSLHARHGDLVRFRFAHKNCYSVRHPQDVHHVLVDQHTRYGKQTIGYQKLSLFLGNGLVTAGGTFWKRQRRIAQPAFHRKRIAAFAETMSSMGEDMMQRIAPAIARGESIEISREMMAVTLRVVASTVLSIDVEHREGQVADSVSLLLDVFNDALTRVVPIHEWFPTRTRRDWREAMRVLDSIVYDVIASRRRAGGGTADLLGMLMDAADEETGERMSDVQLRDEVMTMFMAGHETTANALTWTLYELGRRPDVVAAIHAELDRVLGGRPPALSDLQHLDLTGRVIEESMRLHPPVWLLARSVESPDQIRGHRIRPGSFLFLSPYVTHRHPEFWPDPERFDPGRFGADERKDRLRYAYYPFSGGPRVCIGNAFAEMEGKIVLASMLRRHGVELVPGHNVVADPSVTLRPKYGLRVRMLPRSVAIA